MSLLANGRTSYIVILAARTLERDIKFALGRAWHPPPPFRSPLRLIPCGDGTYFMLAEPLIVEVQRPTTDRSSMESLEIEIPKGFSTDLASVPQPLWPIFPPWERYGPAAVLHDYLYCPIARPLCLEVPSAVAHVTSRGNARQRIVRDEQDREVWEAVVSHTITRVGWLCQSIVWTVMSRQGDYAQIAQSTSSSRRVSRAEVWTVVTAMVSPTPLKTSMA